ncbi:MAG TPA: orotidine-5'-phosphate decarboxylase [Candidatus Limnocylindria bacterium]|nr:orotidine-5'-phosphate decarboxylase [Candidatus Limnocylindria bacterium]
MSSFVDRLASSMRSRDSIVCVGLDPEPDRIPGSLGRGTPAALKFLRRVIAATSHAACCYKPNIAFFERYGAGGADLLGLVLQAIPRDIPVILDAKRGDVPSTASAYAEAVFARWKVDATTVSPYLGLDSVEPFAERGFAFVLARTSNPGARDLQDLDAGGRPLYERVVEAFAERFAADRVGFVVGATYPDEARRLRALAPEALFLMPGVGAQGGELADAIRAGLDARGGGVLPSASRSVLYASSGADFDAAAARAADELRRAANEARLAGARS